MPDEIVIGQSPTTTQNLIGDNPVSSATITFQGEVLAGPEPSISDAPPKENLSGLLKVMGLPEKRTILWGLSAGLTPLEKIKADVEGIIEGLNPFAGLGEEKHEEPETIRELKYQKRKELSKNTTEFMLTVISFIPGGAGLLGKFKFLEKGAKGGKSAIGAIAKYSKLKKLKIPSGYQRHHIIEARFAKVFGLKESEMPAVVIPKALHKTFTRQWRKEFPYGKAINGLTREKIWDKAKEIYKDYPELLQAVKHMFE